jgi:transposase
VEVKMNARQVTCGIDWAEQYHDVALVDEQGQLVAKRRIGEDAQGFAMLTELLADAGDNEDNPIPIAIETPRGLLVAAPACNRPRGLCHQPADRCITFDTIRPGVSAARREQAPWDLPQVRPNPRINNSFHHQSRVATNRRRRRIRDSSDENGAILHG